MTINNDTFILSSQGWLSVIVSGSLFLFFSMTGLHFFQFLTGALLISFLVLFRNPERSSPLRENLGILCGVDGIVLNIEDVSIDEQPMKKITILNGLWDVSILRAPFNGVVQGCQIRYGISLGLENPLSESLNEKAVLSFRSSEGNEVFVEHTSAKSCFSIRIYKEKGDSVKEGARYGFLARGRTIYYIPSDVALSVYAGSNVRAGESILGNFNV